MSTPTSLGKLFLIPVPVGNSNIDFALPLEVKSIVKKLRFFIVEHPKTARHFLKQIGSDSALQALQLEVLDEHTNKDQLQDLLKPLLAGEDVGLMSEAGCPGIADPGATLVALAHSQNILVHPFVGPSSILLSLMASGLDGQRFTFHGYLPTEKTARIKRIQELDKQSSRHSQTQIFIETPYRNSALLNDLINTLSSDTLLCIAIDLMSESEFICTKTVADWKKTLPDVNKHLAIFLFLNTSKNKN